METSSRYAIKLFNDIMTSLLHHKFHERLKIRVACNVLRGHQHLLFTEPLLQCLFSSRIANGKGWSRSWESSKPAHDIRLKMEVTNTGAVRSFLLVAIIKVAPNGFVPFPAKFLGGSSRLRSVPDNVFRHRDENCSRIRKGPGVPTK